MNQNRRKLPVGVTLTYTVPRHLRHDPRPECRRWRYFAHVGHRGVSYAKAFDIEAHGEARAFELARAWREEMVRRLRAGGKVHGKMGQAGVRRSVAGRL